MTTHIFVATVMGMFTVAQGDGKLEITAVALEEKALTAVAVSDEVIVAGSREGIWRSTDGGKSWENAGGAMKTKHVRWIAHSPYAADYFLAGTEPAAIYVSRDRGRTWQGRPEVESLRDAHGWFLPYSSGAGCVRGFAMGKPETAGVRVYAAVEVGGILVSGDHGASWRLAAGSDGSPEMHRDLAEMVHPDVHSVTVHPTSADLVTAATGGGLYRSVDGGRRWENIYRCYIRAVWVDPADPHHMIAGPADGVSRNGRIEESRDGGLSWKPASQGMAATPWNDFMVERFARSGQGLFAILSNGELWLKRTGKSGWRHVLPGLPQVKAVAAGTAGGSGAP